MVTTNQNPRASEASLPKPVSDGIIITISIVTIEIINSILLILKWFFNFIAMRVTIKAPGIMTNDNSAGRRKSNRKSSKSMR